MPKIIDVTELVLRDAHQSLMATRMAMEDMIPACADLDQAGYWSIECWGGATFDSCIRFLNEDPWERLRQFRKLLPNSRLQMLLRGQNLLGYRHYEDSVVDRFVDKAAENGMDVFRVFDALNDIRNLRRAVAAVRRTGKHAQGTICYTVSPLHTPGDFVEMAEKLLDLGCDSICIKDMAGLLPPHIAFQIVRGLKTRVKIPVVVHTHETAGFGAAAYYAAVEAGGDAVDTSISPFANGTGQPDTWRMLQALSGHPRRPSYDLAKLSRLRDKLTRIYAELAAFTSPRNEVVDNDVLIYQVPGGMLSNFRNQLKEQKMADRFVEVMREMPYVRECLGWIPLVTPTSQIVGVQAMLNVKFGRWKNFSPEAMKIALGYYGKTPGPIDPDVLALAEKLSGKPRFTGRPADMLEPRMPKIRAELAQKGLPADDEHCVIYAMFPQELEKLYRARDSKTAAPVAVPVAAAAPPPEVKAPAPAPILIPGTNKKISHLALTVDGRRHDVSVEELV